MARDGIDKEIKCIGGGNAWKCNFGGSGQEKNPAVAVCNWFL